MARSPIRPSARAAPRVPATTAAAFRGYGAIALAAVGALGIVAGIAGSRSTTDQSQNGVSNTTLIVGSIAAIFVAYFISRGSGSG